MVKVTLERVRNKENLHMKQLQSLLLQGLGSLKLKIKKKEKNTAAR